MSYTSHTNYYFLIFPLFLFFIFLFFILNFWRKVLDSPTLLPSVSYQPCYSAPKRLTFLINSYMIAYMCCGAILFQTSPPSSPRGPSLFLSLDIEIGYAVSKNMRICVRNALDRAWGFIFQSSLTCNHRQYSIFTIHPKFVHCFIMHKYLIMTLLLLNANKNITCHVMSYGLQLERTVALQVITFCSQPPSCYDIFLSIPFFLSVLPISQIF